MNHQAAAHEQVTILKALNDGPLFVGSSTLPGRTIKMLEPAPVDNVKRYTDCYLSQREFGFTGETYNYVKEMLPQELCRFLKCETSGSKQQLQASSDQLNTLLAAQEDEEEEGEQDAEKSDSDHEDEFEDLEDDDYNAEKYFNDGDDYGEGDDGDDEAAY